MVICYLLNLSPPFQASVITIYFEVHRHAFFHKFYFFTLRIHNIRRQNIWKTIRHLCIMHLCCVVSIFWCLVSFEFFCVSSGRDLNYMRVVNCSHICPSQGSLVHLLNHMVQCSTGNWWGQIKSICATKASARVTTRPFRDNVLPHSSPTERQLSRHANSPRYLRIAAHSDEATTWICLHSPPGFAVQIVDRHSWSILP